MTGLGRSDRMIQDNLSHQTLISSSHSSPAPAISLAVDPNEISIKNKPIKQELEPSVSPSYHSSANINFSKSPASSATPHHVQVTARALLMNIKPDPSFDPNIKIKKEFSSDTFWSPFSDMNMMETSESITNNHWAATNTANMNDIKKEVLDELFDTSIDKEAVNKVPTQLNPASQPSPRFLVPQLSIASETEESSVEADDFYNNVENMKTEPISPPGSSGSLSENDHENTGFQHHGDLDNIVASFGRSKVDVTLGTTICIGRETNNNNNNNNNNNSFITNNFGSGCKAELNLPDLDLDFSNILDESIADISMSEQDFLQIRMDTLDACSEVMSNV